MKRRTEREQRRKLRKTAREARTQKIRSAMADHRKFMDEHDSNGGRLKGMLHPLANILRSQSEPIKVTTEVGDYFLGIMNSPSFSEPDSDL
jgi:hypothetical protein